MNWPLIGIWRLITVVSVLDVAITATLVIRTGASLAAIAIASVAFAGGASMMAALAFRARDLWLIRNGLDRQP